MTYEDAIIKLQLNHIYPMKVRKDLKTGNILGIEVGCAPIMKESKMTHIKNVLGDGWKLVYFPNDNNYILITEQ